MQGRYSIGLLYWLLAREVLRLRGAIDRYATWEVAVDLFFYRDPEELKALEDEKAAATAAAAPETGAAFEEVAPVFDGGDAPVESFAAPEGFDAAAAQQWTEASDAGAPAQWGEAAVAAPMAGQWGTPAY